MRYARLVSGALVLSCHSIDLASHSQPHYLYLISTRPFWGLCRFPHAPRHAELQRQLSLEEEELLAGEGDEGSHMPPQGGVHCLHPLIPRALQPLSLLLLVCKHPNRSGDLVSRRSPCCVGRRWEFPSSSVGLPAQGSSTCGTSPKTLLGVCSPRRICQDLHPSCCWLHPKTDRFGVWLASVPGLAGNPLLTWCSMPMGRYWRGAMVPPEPTPCSGGGLRLCGASDGHPDPKSTRGGQRAALLGPVSQPF